MSELKGVSALKARYNYDRMSNWGITEKTFQEDSEIINRQASKINVRGKQSLEYADPLLRLREDKLRSMRRALFNSYQSAVIQFDKDDRLKTLDPQTGQIVKEQGFHFRCLINHDKLKVDYQDKILSIPYRQVPVDYENDSSIPTTARFVDTGTEGTFLDEAGNPVLNESGQVVTGYRVKPGDVFKWISGNQGYMPDSYWIIFLQYSQETAYFRGQIRKADDEIQIIPIESDGSEGQPLIYHGWTVGPNEDDQIWNVKKGVVWNDLYYTKLLYITKDEYTSAYFSRFQRVVINGETWEIAAYNDNYGTTNKNSTGGMIRVALKETYTSTNEVIKEMKQTEQVKNLQIIGPDTVQSYDVVKYYVPNGTLQWSVPAAAPVKIKSQTENEIKLQILKVSSKSTFDLGYGEQVLTITVKPFI